MLEPLDPEKLAALLSGRYIARCGQISSARWLLVEEGDLRNGVRSLLDIYPLTFEARTSYEGDDIDKWWIYFRVRC